MNLLQKITGRKEKEPLSKKKFNPYFELNQIGIPIEKRREIVENVYGFFGRMVLKPIVFKIALREIKEEKLYGEDALKMLKSYINMPYNSQTQESVLED